LSFANVVTEWLAVERSLSDLKDRRTTTTTTTKTKTKTTHENFSITKHQTNEQTPPPNTNTQIQN